MFKGLSLFPDTMFGSSLNNAVYKNRAQGCCVAKFIAKMSRKCLIREAIKRLDFEISMSSRGSMPLQVGKSIT